ncbi:MAG: TPM domain-containing protein [Saprospiraceae bacterium]
MKLIKNIAIFTLVLLVGSCQFLSSIKSSSYFPQPKGFVNDFEQLFTKNETDSLENRLKNYQHQTTREIAVVSLKTIAPYTDFDQYAINLSNYWGVGNKDSSNGLTIVFSKNLRKVRINTGIGTQKIFTDSTCQNIINQTLIPAFKESAYYNGIQKSITEIMAKWN